MEGAKSGREGPDENAGGGLRAPVKGEGSSGQMPSPYEQTTPPAGFDPDATIAIPDTGPPEVRRVAPVQPSASSSRFAYHPPQLLQPNDVLGGRYDIMELLGEGGMGAVYKARDRELDRFVALKLIRPDLAADPSILVRFKQELLLAHQVTHRNAIRIYDLSEADGVKFITMEFIEGTDLRRLLREKGKVPPSEAVAIIRQVCLALNAAHSVGVIHRDLKPPNIMQDKQGRILVMDFGLARSVESDGMTQTGALVGTMDYMSPEQALGKELDQRSDIFALGLVFYELLTGHMPFRAESAIASLLKRSQERAVPAVDLDPTVPQGISDIVSKCLERDLSLRYQNVQEVLNDLDAWEGKRPVAASQILVPPAEARKPLPWKGIAITVLAGSLVAAGFLFRGKMLSNVASTKPKAPVASLAILPFRNASGDASLDWLGSSLAEMLSTDVGQSSQLRTVSPANLHQILSDLHVSSDAVLDPTTIRRLADFSNADRVVWGTYARFGEQIRIDATLQDIKNDRAIPLKLDIPSEKDVPHAIDQLSESIREKLSLPNDVLGELRASSFKPNSTSVDALRDYNEGMAFERDGKNLEARRQFEAATQADPNFALAFARLAQTYSSLGYDADAERSAQKAVTLSENFPEAEKYLISAIHLQVIKNYPEAIKVYENLAKVSPDNTDVQSALAGLYQDSGDLGKAREYYQKILSANPKDITATLNLGRIDLKSGDPQASLDPLNRAYSMAIQVDNQEQKATSLHLMAVAYRMLSKPQEVLRNEQEAVAIWRAIGQKRGLAFSLNEIAKANDSLGKSKDALSNFQEALDIRREIGDKRGLGDTLIDLGNHFDDAGDHDQALKMYKEALQLERDIGSESLQAICLNNIGTAYSEKGQYEDALTYYQQALQLREKSKVPQDIVEAVHNLGETSAEMGQYDQAVSYYLRALDLRRSMDDRRGAAIESYSLGTLFAYQGRFGAAIKSKQDALQTFRDIKDKTTWMSKMLNGTAGALILAGRGDEAKAYLDESSSLSQELKNNAAIAETLGVQGDAFFYSGDFKSASGSYAEAMQAANLSKEPEAILFAKVNLAKVQVQEGHATNAVTNLRKLVQQANDLGYKYTSVQSSILISEAMVQSRDYSHARQELESALLIADKLGMQPLSVRVHYLLASLAQKSNDRKNAQDDYREVLRLLDAMKKDPGAEKLLQRADFKTMYEESSRAIQSTTN